MSRVLNYLASKARLEATTYRKLPASYSTTCLRHRQRLPGVVKAAKYMSPGTQEYGMTEEWTGLLERPFCEPPADEVIDCFPGDNIFEATVYL